MPIIIKGVLTAEDSKPYILMLCFRLYLNLTPQLINQSYVNNAARLAIQAGAFRIIVSNHGARQLDYVPATIMALEEV